MVRGYLHLADADILLKRTKQSRYVRADIVTKVFILLVSIAL
jgi:hypothetical protein